MQNKVKNKNPWLFTMFDLANNWLIIFFFFGSLITRRRRWYSFLNPSFLVNSDEAKKSLLFSHDC